ncbi:hypothetical protein ACTS9D_00935 [Empedobacter brevis]
MEVELPLQTAYVKIAYRKVTKSIIDQVLMIDGVPNERFIPLGWYVVKDSKFVLYVDEKTNELVKTDYFSGVRLLKKDEYKIYGMDYLDDSVVLITNYINYDDIKNNFVEDYIALADAEQRISVIERLLEDIKLKGQFFI